MQYVVRGIASSLLLVLLAGCTASKPKVDPKSAPPPPIPSQAELASQFQSSYKPLADAISAGTDVNRHTGESIAKALSAAKAKTAAEQNGPAALKQVTSELEDLMKNANDKKLWGATLSACDALAAVDPENPDIAQYRSDALVQLNRPVVKITGTTRILSKGKNNKTVFFMDVYLPDRNKTVTVKESVGDEFLGLRFVDVIGNDQGAQLEYKATGDVFSVMRPK